MKKLFRSPGKPWFLTLLGVLALAALIWFLGPLFGFAGSYPLEETRPRWILIGFCSASGPWSKSGRSSPPGGKTAGW